MAQLLAIPLSAILMTDSAWLPMFLGLGAMTLGVIVLIPLPETLNDNVGPSTANSESREETPTEANPSKYLFQTFKSTISESRFVFASPVVATLVFTFLVNSLGWSAAELLLQYTSKRYDLTIAQVSLSYHTSPIPRSLNIST